MFYTSIVHSTHGTHHSLLYTISKSQEYSIWGETSYYTLNIILNLCSSQDFNITTWNRKCCRWKNGRIMCKSSDESRLILCDILPWNREISYHIVEHYVNYKFSKNYYCKTIYWIAEWGMVINKGGVSSSFEKGLSNARIQAASS